MDKYFRYVFGVIFGIVVIVLLVVGFNLIRNILSPDTPREESCQEQRKEKVDLLGAPAADKQVRYTVNGPIVGKEQHRAVRITVDRNNRTVDVIEGYEGRVIKTQSTSNTQDAYQAFVDALNGANFTKEFKAQGRGIESQLCPLGQRYAYELGMGTSDAFRTWSNSCSADQGTFGGNRSVVQTLFQKQIPNYNQFVSGVQL